MANDQTKKVLTELIDIANLNKNTCNYINEIAQILDCPTHKNLRMPSLTSDSKTFLKRCKGIVEPETTLARSQLVNRVRNIFKQAPKGKRTFALNRTLAY